MYKKILTIDCPKCKFYNTTEDGMSFCSWGKSKKEKRLIFPQNHNQKMKDCNLLKVGG